MSRLRYKENIYKYKELFELSKKSPMYKTGEVEDMDTGEFWDIENIKENKIKLMYFDELVTSKQKKVILKNIKKKDREEELKYKFQNNTISKIEMFEYLTLLNENKITPNYNYDKGYLIVNLNKIPMELSDGDYGKFHKLLIYLSSNHYNKITHKNGKYVTKDDLTVFLKYKNKIYLNRFLRRLKKINLIREETYGGIKYLIINPAYAKKNMMIDSTLYRMFKKDLDDCLTEHQIYYLNLRDDSVDLDNLIPIKD